MADNLVYEESLNTEIDSSEFISKKWVYVNDNNSQNYTSQIVLDSTPLSNAGGYIAWQEGFIVMPLAVQLTSSDNALLPANTSVGDYAWAFKSGFWQMINSMTVEFNNQNIIQQTPFLNVFRSFKANTSFSMDDLLNVGSTVGFYPDTADSWSFNTNFNVTSSQSPYVAFGNGVPYTNNNNFSFVNNKSATSAFAVADVAAAIQILPQSDVAGTGIGGARPIYSGVGAGSTSAAPLNALKTHCNEGMKQRQKWYNYNPLSPLNSNGQSIVNPVLNCTTNYRSSLVSSTAGSLVWNVYAKLRLKDLADFFEKMPLLKGSTIRFYINTNQASTTFTTVLGTIDAATGATTLGGLQCPQIAIEPNGNTVIGGLSNPLMIASNYYGNGCSTLGNGTYTLSVSIVQNNFATQQNKPAGSTQLKSCRLYAPVYYMNPLAESRYLSLTPTKKIMYKDVFQYQFNKQGTGNFNILVSNGISNICSVLVVPFISTGLNIVDSGGNAISTTLSSPLNPFCPAPAVPDPIMISNFNILISGVNLFLNNEQYDFEAFLEQLAQSNQINGGLTTGLASGLISESMFNSGYRYYYGDASRILPSEQGVSRSVQVVGNNLCAQPIDLMVFVEFMREITIDISTGARIE